jgi:FG-GAP repeat
VRNKPATHFVFPLFLAVVMASGMVLSCTQDQPPPLYPMAQGQAELTPYRPEAPVEMNLERHSENKLLKSPSQQPDDRFGESIAIALKTLVVGAPNTSGGGTVWVFDLDHSNTAPIQLIPPHLHSGDKYGTAVAIEPGGNFIAVGAPHTKVDNKINAGVVYMWKKSKNGNDWNFDGTYSREDLPANSKLGSTVAINRETLLAGAPFTPLFITTTSTLGEVITTTMPVDRFSNYRTIAFHGVVATWMRDSNGNLNEDDLLQPDPYIANTQVGHALFLEGAQAIVGAKTARASEQVEAGKAYIYLRRKSGWSNQPSVSISQTGNSIFKGDNNTISGNGPAHHFGSAVCIKGSVALAGTPGDSEGGLLRSGSVNVYERIDSAWTPVQYISAKIKDRSDPTKFTEDRSDDDEFGSAVGIADTHFVIGAPKKSINDQKQAGAVYAYQIKMGSNPMEEEFVVQLVQAKPVANSEFGAALACTPDIIAVSAPGTQDFSTLGQIYIFNRTEIASQISWGVPVAAIQPASMPLQSANSAPNPVTAP